MQISYDSRAITIDGKRTLILCGAIHYPRSTPAMWPRLFERSRQAGINTIDTYVFWNLHERRRGEFDFSDRLDLELFCDLAKQHGMNVILRIGPYICAETTYGGFPFWLRDIPGMLMRTDNEPFKREMERWTRYLCHRLHRHFAPQGGPIVLAQLENEFANIAKTYGAAGQRYLQWVADFGADLKLGVPLVMCMGGTEGVLETINESYPHKRLEAHFAEHPDQPAINTELYPAFYNTWTAPRLERSPQGVAYSVARFIAAGGTGIDYYMWHGGTNFAREAMYLQTTSYDFDAPLDEFGLETTKCRHLARLHHVLLDNADALLQSDRPAGQAQGDDIVFTYRDGLRFVCRDKDQSVRIFKGDVLLYDTTKIAAEDLITRREEPIGGLLSPQAWGEPMPGERPTGVVSDHPIEQLKLTNDETDYCWYSTSLDVGRDGTGTLLLDGVADVVHVFVDGELLATSATPLTEDRGPIDGDGFRQSFALKLTPGRHQLDILCCAIGLIKGDWALGNQNMVNERKGLWRAGLWNGAPLGPWTMRTGLVGEQQGLPAKGIAGGSAVAPVGRPLQWFTCSFDRPTGDGPFAIDLTPMGKGMAWVNGKCLGRYWQAPAKGNRGVYLDGMIVEASRGIAPQVLYHVPAEWLQASNRLVLFEEIWGDPQRIVLVRLSQK